MILKTIFDFSDDTYMVSLEKKVHLDIEKQLHLLFEQNVMTKEKALVNVIERKQWSHQKNKINTWLVSEKIFIKVIVFISNNTPNNVLLNRQLVVIDHHLKWLWLCIKWNSSSNENKNHLMFSNENLFNIPHLKLHVRKINRKKKIQYMCSTQNKENLIFFVSYTTIPRFFRVHIFRMQDLLITTF